AILTQPSATATAGIAFGQQPVVQVLDASGNLVTSDNTTLVTAARSTGTGTLLGTTSVTAINGVATFTNLKYKVAETMKITFSAPSVTSTPASTDVVVSDAGVDHFTFATVT